MIPASVKGIGAYAFAGRRNLKTVTVTENPAEGVGGHCFEDTAWLTSQPNGLVYLADYLYIYKGELPENAKIEVPAGTIGICPGAFSGQDNLREVVLPEGIKFWGNDIFLRCSSLVAVSLPADMKTLPGGIFAECRNLKTVTLPEGLTCIAACAFGYSGLEFISIPSSVKSIYAAFEGCESLKELYFPAGVEELGVAFLTDCCALERVLIPASVKEIDGNPFLGCNSLTHVFFEGSSFDDFAKKLTFVDDELRAQLEEIPFYFYSEEKPTEPGNYWHYVDGIPTPWETEE